MKLRKFLLVTYSEIDQEFAYRALWAKDTRHAKQLAPVGPVDVLTPHEVRNLMRKLDKLKKPKIL